MKEKIELIKDRLENINATLSMPIPDNLHVQALRELVPELIEDMTKAIQEIEESADNIPDRLAELEKIILDYYLAKGYQVGVGGWGFNVEIESNYKSKQLVVYFCEAKDEHYDQILKIEAKTTKEMWDKAIECFSSRQDEGISFPQ